MTATAPDSVGIVTPATFHHTQPFALQNGDELKGFDLVYETWRAKCVGEQRRFSLPRLVRPSPRCGLS